MFRFISLLLIFSLPAMSWGEQLFEPGSDSPFYKPSILTLEFGSESSGYQDMQMDLNYGLNRQTKLFAGIGQSYYDDNTLDYTQESYFLGFGTHASKFLDINMEYEYWDQGNEFTSDTIKGALEWISPKFSVSVLPELRYISMDDSVAGSRVGIRNPGLGFQGRLFAARDLSFAVSRYTYRYSDDPEVLSQYPRRTNPLSRASEQFDKRRTILEASYAFPEMTLSLEWLKGVTAVDSSIYNSLSTILLWDLDRSWGVQFRLGETTYQQAEDSETFGNLGLNYRW